MKPVTTILARSVASPFYRQHAGFFLFLFFILFGIYPNIYQVEQVHYGIILGILTKASNFLLFVSIWFLYALRVYTFFHNCIGKNDYLFLQNLNAIAPKQRFYYLLQLVLTLYAPALVYGLAVMIVGLYEKHFLSASLAVLVLISFTLLVTQAFLFSLQKNRASFFDLNKWIPKINFPKNLFAFLMRYIFREQFLAMAGLKLVSFCCLYFFISTDPESYKDRILWLIFITSMIGHSIIIYKNQHFMETKMAFYRNMPIRLFKTILVLFAVYLIILIPEFWALKGVAMEHQAFKDYFIMAATAPCMLLLMHVMLYTEDYQMEDYLKMLFGIWTVYFFFGLSNFRWLLPIISLVAAFIIFYTTYYKYEKNMEVEGIE
ncbi:MAG: hypothetical protein JST58_12925 [Bacteroidetes bacterium]|nr:hypothetical protein [Bacteroidota bacterium]